MRRSSTARRRRGLWSWARTRAALERAVRCWAVAGGITLMAIVTVTSANTGGFILDSITGLWGWDLPGLPGYEDFVTLAMGSAALMFVPYCQQRRGHVVVGLITGRAPASLSRALNAFWLAATVGVAGFLAYWMAIGMVERRSDGAVSRVLGVPEWPFFLPGVLSLLLWGLVAALQIVDDGPWSDGEDG